MDYLVDYGSSDEEDLIDQDQRRQLNPRALDAQQSELSGLKGQSPPRLTSKEPTVASAEDDSVRPSGALFISPSQAMTPASSALSAPSSPYANHRATVRSLTLPTTPNLDIPQSPLCSPTPAADEKFSHFLDLKKQGIHFNAKLASSSALKNPSLLPKLISFAGVGREWQYRTTLPIELWDPAGLPTWAYKEELAEAQYRNSKKKEEKVRVHRESVDFVAAGTSRQPSGSGIPKAPRASAAERVMAGLENDSRS